MRGADFYEPGGAFVLLRKAGTFAPSKIRISFPADASTDAFLEEVLGFMRACGYPVPPDAILDFVDEVSGRPMDDPHLEDMIETDGTSSEDIDD